LNGLYIHLIGALCVSLKKYSRNDSCNPVQLYFFAKNLPKFEKRWVKPGKNGEISGKGESL